MGPGPKLGAGSARFAAEGHSTGPADVPVLAVAKLAPFFIEEPAHLR